VVSAKPIFLSFDSLLCRFSRLWCYKHPSWLDVLLLLLASFPLP
jgi:hypothetical protein